MFTKLWRVERVLQFTRRKIRIRHVLWPMMLLLLGSLCVLVVWTVVDSLQWERRTIDDFTGESIGICTCDNLLAYLGPLVAFMMIPLCLTALMARKTSDVADAYSEGHWIYVLIVIQLEAILVALPMVWILRDVSSDASYFGFVVMLWVFPMSTLGVVVAPKIMSCIQDVHGRNSSINRRGERSSEIRVTGLNLGADIGQTNLSSTAERSREMSALSNNDSQVAVDSNFKNEIHRAQSEERKESESK
jgi:7 transmembrane sweet-taste receptor of 3 GCPR